jgi:hypothetical protein
MKYIKLSVKVLLILVILFLGTVKIASNLITTSVSMISLVSTPLWNHGNKIQTIGYLELEFEGNAVYVSEESCRRGISKNGVWVRVPEEIESQKELLNHKFVIIEGTFSCLDQGHFGMFSGTIKDITRIEVWPFYDDYE